MPITPDQALAIKVKRWERVLHRAAVSIAILAGVVMIFFLMRLFRKRIDNHTSTNAAIEREAADYHSRTLSGGVLDQVPGKNTGGSPVRKVLPVSNIVDLSHKIKPDADVTGKEAEEKKVEVEKPRQPSTQSMAIENLPQKQKDIEKLIEEFFEATRITEMLPIVRESRRVRPLMEEYYQRNPIKKRFWRGISWVMPIDVPGYRFAFVEAMFDSSLPLQVVVEETPAGGFLLDWESSVQYSEMGWKVFLSERPDQPKMFRVIASKPEGAPDEPSDGQISVLQLRHPHEPGTVNARFDNGNPRFAPLIKQMKLNHWKDVPVTLRLYFPDTNAVSNEVQISGVLGKGWLNLEK